MTAAAGEAGRPPAPPRRRLLPGLTVSVIVFGVLIAGTELALRALQVPFRATFTPSENALARFDEELGWSYIPNRSSVRPFGRDGRPVPIHFDGIGARVASPDVVRDGRPTAIFVGCSYTMGHGVPYEESFVGRLDADPEFPFQVVNLGVQAYGTDQSLLILKRHIAEFQVAAVVYTFLEAHVLRNSNDDRRLILPDATFLGTKPRFALRPDGTLYLEKKAARYEDLFQSNLVSWMRRFWYEHGPMPGPDLTRALVREMRAVTEASGGRFLVVLWRQEISYPESVAKARRLQGDPPLRSLDLSLVDTGVDAPPGWEQWVIPGDYHPDARAHARVAALVQAKFAQLGMIPAAP